jgi:hypothetical protein
MATSNSYNFTATRNEIIDTALRMAANIGDYEVPTSTQITKAAFLLNSIIKSYHNIGMPVWTKTSTDILCNAFDTNGRVLIGLGYTIGIPKPLKLFQALLVIGDDTRTLWVTDKQSLFSYAPSTGAPSALYYQPNRDHGELVVYPRPDTYHQLNASVRLYFQNTLQDVDTSSDEIDFPVEWIRLITYELAVDLAPGYGLAIAERELLIRQRDSLKKEAMDFDVEEGSISLQP